MTEHPPSPPSTGASSDLAAQRFARRVLRQWWLIAACCVVSAVAAYVASSSRTKQYEASSTIQVGSVDLVSIFLADAVSISDVDPERQKSGAIESFQLPNTRDRAVAELNGRATSAELAKQVRIESVPDSAVARIIARDPDPARAKAMADAMVAGFIAQREFLVHRKLAEAQNSVKRRLRGLSPERADSQEGQLLQERFRQIGVLGALNDGNITLIQGATPPGQAVAPKPKRDFILGGMAGFLLGLGIALLRARLDDRVRDAAELAELWDIPIVGTVPPVSGLGANPRALPPVAALESLALARTSLRYLHVGGRVKTLMVTSTLEGEGKSTLAWNLAIAASTAGSRVVVVDADLRRPQLAARLDLGGAGLSEVLAGIAKPEDAIRSVSVQSADGVTATVIDVVPSGLTPPSPVALLEGPATQTFLASLRERYDLVLIDTPPATVVADALSLVDRVDGVLIVARMGIVRSGAYAKLRDLLTGVGAPVIGQIVNSDSAAKGNGYYYAAERQRSKAAKSAKATA